MTQLIQINVKIMILPRILYVSGIKDYYDYANQVQVAEEILIVISYFLFFFFFIFIRDKNLFTEEYR